MTPYRDSDSSGDALKRVRAAEARFENDLASALYRGELGIRGTGLYGALADGVDLLSGVVSCRWGCRESGHAFENVLRRFVNAALASLRLAFAGYYDEALATVRVGAEILNLVQLFDADPAKQSDWLTLAPEERQQAFKPVQVRRLLEQLGVTPFYDKDSYAALCEAGVHLTAESARQSHDFEGDRLYVGPFPSIPALLLVWTELAYAVSACLGLGAVSAGLGREEQQRASSARSALRAAIGAGEMRVTNYQAVRRSFLDQMTQASAASVPQDV